VPWLAELLDDPDVSLRLEGISGMSLFANGLPVQTAATPGSLEYLQLQAGAPYRTPDTLANFAVGTQAISRNEAKYLAFWKQWWAANRAAFGK
jgi:hypothetical protein